MASHVDGINSQHELENACQSERSPLLWFVHHEMARDTEQEIVHGKEEQR